MIRHLIWTQIGEFLNIYNYGIHRYTTNMYTVSHTWAGEQVKIHQTEKVLIDFTVVGDC